VTSAAEWIRTARKERGLSQTALSEQVGASQAQISQWETGKTAPGADALEALKRVLGDSGELVPGHEAPAPHRQTGGAEGSAAPRGMPGVGLSPARLADSDLGELPKL